MSVQLKFNPNTRAPITGLDLLEAKLDSIPFLSKDHDEQMESANKNEKANDQGHNTAVPTSGITDGSALSHGNEVAPNVGTGQSSPPEPFPSVTTVQQGQEESGEHFLFFLKKG
jgi:hypothetical protein